MAQKYGKSTTQKRYSRSPKCCTMFILQKYAATFPAKSSSSICIYSEDNAYLWFSGGMRKTYALQYPGILAVWHALTDAKKRGYRHLEFMDVGLPFRKHGYRDFVLRFGGKQPYSIL